MFPLENTDYSAADAQLWFATRLSGVYANNHLAVSAAGGMGVNIGKGIAWLHYGEFAGAVYGNTSEINLPIPLADATYPRIDRVVIRYDAVQNKGFLTISPGTPASNPAPAALLRNENAYEISLAKVYVAAGATEIFAANITDERLDESVCGLMRDGVTGIDTSVIHAQAISMLQQLQIETDDLLSDLHDAYNSAISGTLAGDLQTQISARPTLTALNVVFPAGKWALSGNVYTQTVTGIDFKPSKDKIEVDILLNDSQKDILRETWAELRNIAMVNGGLTANFWTEPTVDLALEVFRFRTE